MNTNAFTEKIGRNDNMIIAIDGLAINGKTTLANKIAKKLNYAKVSTGSIYRCIALEMINKNISIENIENEINKIKDIKVDFIEDKVLLNGNDVSKKIKTEDISILSCKIATNLKLKEFVRKMQMEYIRNNNVVIEGRDICTRIAPNADCKFYLYSDFEVRLKRLIKAKPNIDPKILRKDLEKLDYIDKNEGNFIKPINAIEINTDNLSILEVYNLMIKEINNKITKLSN